MGLQKRLDAEGDLLTYELHEEQIVTRETPQVVDLYDYSDPLGAARGVFMGVLLGCIFWAVILWVLL